MRVLEAECDPFDLHATALLGPQRELDTLDVLEPQTICGAPTPRRWSYPVVPFAREALGQQDTSPCRELCQRERLLLPRGVDGHGGAPTGAVVFHERDVDRLLRPEPPQACTDL